MRSEEQVNKMMNDAAALAGMIPYDSIGLYEPPKHRFIFKMPRVVPDQKNKFETDELFRRLSRESEVSPPLFALPLRTTRRGGGEGANIPCVDLK